MAPPNSRSPRERRSKTLAQARSAFAVNLDFGYLNSQVPDKNAFRHFVGAPAGDETQLELQEFSQTEPGSPTGHFDADISPADTKPDIIKIEKENAAPTVSTIPSVAPGRLKRARIIEVDVVKTEEDHGLVLGGPSQSTSLSLRIAQLENEVAFLRAQIRVNQETVDRFIGMQRDWEDLRRTCLLFQNRVGGLAVRMNRVEGHVDEIVEHLPAHYGWKSEIGSDFDPDATIEVEDGSQPWWSEESDVGAKKEEF